MDQPLSIRKVMVLITYFNQTSNLRRLAKAIYEAVVRTALYPMHQ